MDGTGTSDAGLLGRSVWFQVMPQGVLRWLSGTMGNLLVVRDGCRATGHGKEVASDG